MLIDKEVLNYIENLKGQGKKIYLTSGGFDPVHIGHLRCLQETARLASKNDGIVVVLVNADQFLINKKGKPFMKCEERLEIIRGFKGVDIAIPWYDGTQTVEQAIKMIEPHYFTKGGDRNDPTVIPEWDICQQIGCEVVMRVGGDKIQSSSWLISNSENVDAEN